MTYVIVSGSWNLGSDIALRLGWLWFTRTYIARPWSSLSIKDDPTSAAPSSGPPPTSWLVTSAQSFFGRTHVDACCITELAQELVVTRYLHSAEVAPHSLRAFKVTPGWRASLDL
jgi:hypothetical protein